MARSGELGGLGFTGLGFRVPLRVPLKGFRVPSRVPSRLPLRVPLGGLGFLKGFL